MRWLVDHALIFSDLQGCSTTLPEPHVWRSIAYNTQDPDELLEFCLTADFVSRHLTAADPVSQTDAALRRSGQAALGKQRSSHVHPPRAGEGADSYVGNRVAEWIAARSAGLPAEHVEVDEEVHGVVACVDRLSGRCVDDDATRTRKR